MRNALLGLFTCIALSACTFIYTREYIAEPEQPMSARETEDMYNMFRVFLISRKGVFPLSYGEEFDPNYESFRIGGSNAGFALRRDWEDILQLIYAEDNTFHIRLLRITHHPADFSDEYITRFVEQTEELIYEATSESVRLRIVPNDNP